MTTNATTLARPGQARRAPLVRAAYLAAPALFAGYGLLRLVDGIDGSYGPGLWWTASHALLLVSLLLFGSVVAGLLRLAWGRPGRWLAVGVTAVAAAGLILFLRTAAIDVIVGLRAADRATMSELFERYSDVPVPLPAAISGIGPALFFVGLTILLTVLAIPRPRLVPLWSPVVSLGTALIQVSLDLLPIGAAMLGVALAPLARRRPDPRETARRA
jgi:hypothetical protein